MTFIIIFPLKLLLRRFNIINKSEQMYQGIFGNQPKQNRSTYQSKNQTVYSTSKTDRNLVNSNKSPIAIVSVLKKLTKNKLQ